MRSATFILSAIAVLCSLAAVFIALIDVHGPLKFTIIIATAITTLGASSRAFKTFQLFVPDDTA